MADTIIIRHNDTEVPGGPFEAINFTGGVINAAADGINTNQVNVAIGAHLDVYDGATHFGGCSRMDFTGSGVTVSDMGDYEVNGKVIGKKLRIEVTGGGGGGGGTTGIGIKDDEDLSYSDVQDLNFIGNDKIDISGSVANILTGILVNQTDFVSSLGGLVGGTTVNYTLPASVGAYIGTLIIDENIQVYRNGLLQIFEDSGSTSDVRHGNYSFNSGTNVLTLTFLDVFESENERIGLIIIK